MKRREFIALVDCEAVAWPLTVRGQQSSKVIRLGYLGAPLNNPPATAQYQAFRIPSLARPGGDITGLVLQQLEVSRKQVELLRQTFPDRTRLAILSDFRVS